MPSVRPSRLWKLPLGALAAGLATFNSGATPLDRVVFEENVGQADPAVRFVGRARGATMLLTSGEALLLLGGDGSPAHLRMTLLGARPDAQVIGLDPLPGRSNYFIGRDPACWRTGVRHYGRVLVEQAYPGVDVLYYARGGRLEHDFILHAGADPRLVRFEFRGAEHVDLDAGGNLNFCVQGRHLLFERPTIFEEAPNRPRRLLQGGYVQNGGTFAFDVRARDPRARLVIDPAISFSSYLGGSKTDAGLAVAVDPSGSTYVAGLTNSLDFPVVGAFQTALASNDDAFVTKIAPDGATVEYSTYLGGASTDSARGILVDRAGAAYVGGSTFSSDFPVAGAYQSINAGGFDAFAAKLDPAGANLVYSTYLGGTDGDAASGVALDGTGSLYVVGTTDSSDFPLATPIQPGLAGSVDNFITKLSPTGNSLVYSTYLGGSDAEWAEGVAVDGSGAAYVGGATYSPDFPTVNAYQPTAPGSTDGFIAKLAPSGTALAYSTYFGGSSIDWIYDVAVDASGSAYVTGTTGSTDLPTTPGAYQPTPPGGGDLFVTKLAPSGGALDYSTYLGGTCLQGFGEYGRGIAVTKDGSAVVVTETPCSDFPVTDPVQDNATAMAVTALSPAGSSLVFSTYLGGEGGGGWPGGVAVDAVGSIYVAGFTQSRDYPVVNAFQSTKLPYADAFITKIARTCPGPLAVLPAALPGATLGQPYSAQLSASGGTPPYAFGVTGGALPASLSLSMAGLLAGTPASAGTFAFTVTAADDAGVCGNRSHVIAIAGGGAGENVIAALGPGPANGSRVKVTTDDGGATPVDFYAYGGTAWGANVASGRIALSPREHILTAPGPGPSFGPHVRGFSRDGVPLAKVSFFAYATLRYGAKVAAGDVDGDGFDEIVTGAGPGPPFGPHVRGFDYDGTTVRAIPAISFFAYGTLKYGVNTAGGDVEADGFGELLTGPGPGVPFSPQVRAFDHDGGPVTAIPGILFDAFPVGGYGAAVASGDVDVDGFDEILATPGPGAGSSYRPKAVGFSWDGALLVRVPYLDVTATFLTSYGGRVALGDLTGEGGEELLLGEGADPDAGATVRPYVYAAGRAVPLVTFDPFPGAAYGAGVAAGPLGY